MRTHVRGFSFQSKKLMMRKEILAEGDDDARFRDLIQFRFLISLAAGA